MTTTRRRHCPSQVGKKPSSVVAFSVREFFERFPNDAACLEHVMAVRHGLRNTCPKCGVVETTFHRLAERPAYSCAHCGHHVYPCAGTVFQDSRTPLQVWFYAIYLFVATRHGVSGKELQRQLGVTYKTAWRMGMQIRKLTAKADDLAMLQGHVEIDEAYVGGRRPGKRGRGAAGKTIVLGMKQRGGPMAAEVIPDITKATLRDATLRNVEPGAFVSTDELVSYGLLTPDGFRHGQVKHGEKDYSHYDYRSGETIHVNHVESFWWLFKRSIASTHLHVSAKYMQRYLDEFTFRSNRREIKNAMFDLLIAAV
jgi:transposase